MRRKTLQGIPIIALFIIAFSSMNVSAGNPPGLLHSTVLNGVKLDHKTGELWIDRMTAVFLPEPATLSTSIYAYNPDDGGELYATVTDESGKVLYRFDFFGEKKEAPFWILHNYKGTENNTDNPTTGKRVKIPKGIYNMNFYVEGNEFYRFPFTVDVLASDEPFVPEDYYTLEGDWNKLGYLHYTDANPEQNIAWKVWLRNKSRNGNKNVNAIVQVYDGDTLIAESNKGFSQYLNPEWVRYDFNLNFPGGSTAGYLKAKDILAKDGSYTLKMRIDGEPYANWKFEVVNGKLSYKGRTVRGQADPVTFVEGGRDSWWYSKQ